MENIQIKKGDSFIELKVQAVKKPLVGMFSLGMAVIFSIVAILSFYFLAIEGNVAIGFIAFVLFIGLSASYFDGYIWLKKGYEVFKLDKKRGIATMVKVGLVAFNKRKFLLEEIREIRICNRDIDAAVRDSEASWLYGYGHGKICIYAQKNYQFGVSINHKQAVELVSILNNFLSGQASRL